MLSRLLVGLAVSQGVGIGYRFYESAEKYAQAHRESRMRGKPFLVVGGPAQSDDAYSDVAWVQPLVKAKSFFNIQAHGCGDVCTDIDPRTCEGCNFIYGDITDLPFADKEFGSVLCAHVLEHMPDAETCQAAWRELHRVADTVFICVPPKSSIWAWFVPDHYLWVRHVGATVLEVEERDTGDKYLVDIDDPPMLL